MPNLIKDNYEKIKLYLTISIVVIVTISLIYGYWNNMNPRITAFDIYIPKKTNSIKTMNLVLVSDIHYGRSNSIERVEQMVDQINTLNPDLVVFAGDILDGGSPEFLNLRFGKSLNTIKSKFGVLGIIGNHDHLLFNERAREYFKHYGVTILKDSIAVIDSSIYLIGRKYIVSDNATEKRRKSLEDILANVNPEKPLILLDHKPNTFEQAVNNKIDLQLSGHSHNGQLWPLNLITSMIYDINWGYTKINNTQFYVTCGYSTWGPPIRLGSYPEIVSIILHFN
jgi:uncharacterized protein